MNATRTALAVLIALAAAATARAEPLLAGEWQISLTQPGVPGSPTARATQCLVGAQADDPAVIAQRVRPRVDCVVTTQPSGEGDYAWTFDCPQSAMRGDGLVHYTSSEMRGQIHSSTQIGGSSIVMTQDIAAKRVGPCTQ
jgi:hypothetical protein